MYRESYVGPVQDGHIKFHIFDSDVALITADKLKMYVVFYKQAILQTLCIHTLLHRLSLRAQLLQM